MFQRILSIIALMLLSVGSARSDNEFILHTLPRVQSLTGNAATIRTTVTVAVGFTASIAFTADISSIPGASVTTLLHQVINQPYTDTLVVTLTINGPKIPGTYSIFLQAKNGPAIAGDTVTLVIPEVTGWRIFDRNNSPLNLGTEGRFNEVNFALDRNSGVGWFSKRDTLFRFDGEHWTFYPWPVSPDSVYASLSFSPVTIDRLGDVWVAFPIVGFGRLHDGAWTLYDHPDPSIGLTAEAFKVCTYPANMAGDSTGSLWIMGLANSGSPGLVRYDGETWQLYNAATSAILGGGKVRVDRSNTLWMCGPDIVKFDGTYWTTYPTRDLGYGTNGACEILGFDLHNDLWLVGMNQSASSFLSVYSGGKPYALDYDRPLLNVNSVEFLPDGIRWFARTADYSVQVRGGLVRADATRRWVFRTDNSPLPDNVVQFAQADNDGTIWAVTKNGRLVLVDSRLDPDSLFYPGAPASVSSEERSRAKAARSLTCLPNPAGDGAIISAVLASSGRARLSLFDNLGNEVRLLYDGDLGRGKHQFTLATDGLAAGMYYLRVACNDTTEAAPLMIVR
jgi:hypothetical protein